MTRWMLTLFLALLSSGANAALQTDTPVEIELPGLTGGTVRVSDYRGQWVVLNYWATWCAPCRKEIPDLSQLHDSRDDIVVLGLAFEDTEPAVFEEFLAEFSPTYPMALVDVYDPPEPFGAPRALPTTIILHPDGHAVKAFLGPVTGDDIESWVDSAP